MRHKKTNKNKSSKKRHVGFRKTKPKTNTRGTQPSTNTSAPLDFEEMALNKYMALSGVCSRRKAVEFIEKGKVTVNGTVVTKPYHRVKKDDKVIYQDKVLRPETTKQYILLNKPKNCITSLEDPDGRKTVMDIVKDACKERVFPVGRLDRNTTGLLLITNDGDLAKKLSHPSSKVKKLYYATLDQQVDENHINQILDGLDLEDGKVQADACGFVEGSKNYEVGIEVHIGRNRIVRRIFEHFGYQVKKLDRVYYAGLTKKDVPRGRWRHLNEQEIIMLKHFS